MSVAITVTSVISSHGVARVRGYLTASVNYVTGGDTLDFTGATQDAKFAGISPVIPSSQPPTQLWVESMKGNIANFYVAILGSAQNNCKLKVATAFGTELAAGAYPAGITSDIIAYEAEFPLFQ